MNNRRNLCLRALYILLVVLLLLLPSTMTKISNQPAAAAPSANVFTEDFETDGNGSRYTVSEECTDTDDDYFVRTDGTNIAADNVYNSPSNSFFWAAQDTDAAPCNTSAIETITFTDINISGQTSLAFSGLFAEDDATDGNEDWDGSATSAPSLAYVEVNIDSAGYQKILQFAASDTGLDAEPAQDTDFDGVGDGTALTATFASFGANIPGTGTSMDIRIVIRYLDAGDEDLAFDLLKIETPTAVELASFTATPQASAILLQWETATELDNLGFNLYRADTPDGLRAQLNASLIPAQNPGSPVGATYTLLDEGVQPGLTYYYWLEDVDVYGVGTLHGLVAAIAPGQTHLLRPRPAVVPWSPPPKK